MMDFCSPLLLKLAPHINTVCLTSDFMITVATLAQVYTEQLRY